MLVGPAGGAQNSTILSDSGAGNDITNVNLTLKDGAPALPATLITGTFAPTTDPRGRCLPGSGSGSERPILR
jgi:hypothetical protein